MASTYPGAKQTFTNPVGTNTLDTPDHAVMHSTENDTLGSIQDVLGTTAGTSVLKNMALGEVAMRINNANGIMMSSPVGGTMSNIVMNNGTFGTPALTGGTHVGGIFTNPTVNVGTINNSIFGTPSLTGGTATNLTLVGFTGPVVKDKNTTSGTLASSNALGTLYSYAITANLLGTGGWLELQLWGKAFNNTGGNVSNSVILAYNGGTLANTTRTIVTSTGTVDWYMTAYVANTGATNTQKGGFFWSGQETVNGGNYIISGNGTAGIDSTALGTVSVVFQMGTSSASSSITLLGAKTTLT